MKTIQEIMTGKGWVTKECSTISYFTYHKSPISIGYIVNGDKFTCNVESITNKYIHCFCVIIGQVVEFKIKIQDIKMV